MNISASSGSSSELFHTPDTVSPSSLFTPGSTITELVFDSSTVKEVVRAFEIISEISGGVSSSTDEKKLAYSLLEQIRNLPSGWKFCLSLFHELLLSSTLSSPLVVLNIRFWCIQILNDFCNARGFSAEYRRQIIDFIWDVYLSQYCSNLWTSSNSSLDIYFGENVPLLRKVVQLYCSIFFLDYPSFFPDALTRILEKISSLLSKSTTPKTPGGYSQDGGTNLGLVCCYSTFFFSLLLTFDLEYVSEDHLVVKNSLRDPMEVKDAMRLRDVDLIVRFTHELLTGRVFGFEQNVLYQSISAVKWKSKFADLQTTIPKNYLQTMDLALASFARCIIWIDLPYILGPDRTLLNITKALALDRSRGFINPLAGNALGCLEAIIQKRMNSPKKILTLENMGAEEFILDLIAGLTNDNLWLVDESFTLKAAKFIGDVGMHCAMTHKSVKGTQTIFNEEGVPVSQEDIQASFQVGRRIAQSIVGPSLDLFMLVQGKNRAACRHLIPFFGKYTKLFQFGDSDPRFCEIVGKMLQVCNVACRMPNGDIYDDYLKALDTQVPECFTPIEAIEDDGDDGSSFLAFRRELGTLARQVATVDIAVSQRHSIQLVDGLIDSLVSNADPNSVSRDIDAVAWQLHCFSVATKGCCVAACSKFLKSEAAMLNGNCSGLCRCVLNNLVCLSISTVYNSPDVGDSQLIAMKSLLGTCGIMHPSSPRIVQSAINTLCKCAKSFNMSRPLSCMVLTELEKYGLLAVPVIEDGTLRKARAENVTLWKDTEMVSTEMLYHPQCPRMLLEDHMKLFEVVGLLSYRHSVTAGDMGMKFGGTMERVSSLPSLIFRLLESFEEQRLKLFTQSATLLMTRNWVARLLGALGSLMKAFPDSKHANDEFTNADCNLMISSILRVLGHFGDNSDFNIRQGALFVIRKVFYINKLQQEPQPLLGLSDFLQILYNQTLHPLQSAAGAATTTPPSSLLDDPQLRLLLVEMADLANFVCMVLTSGRPSHFMLSVFSSPVVLPSGTVCPMFTWIVSRYTMVYDYLQAVGGGAVHSSEETELLTHAISMIQALVAGYPLLYITSIILLPTAHVSDTRLRSPAQVLLISLDPIKVKSWPLVVSATIKALGCLVSYLFRPPDTAFSELTRICTEYVQFIRTQSSSPNLSLRDQVLPNFIESLSNTQDDVIQKFINDSMLVSCLQASVHCLAAADPKDAQCAKMIQESAAVFSLLLHGAESKKGVPNHPVSLPLLVRFRSEVLVSGAAAFRLLDERATEDTFVKLFQLRPPSAKSATPSSVKL